MLGLCSTMKAPEYEAWRMDGHRSCRRISRGLPYWGSIWGASYALPPRRNADLRCLQQDNWSNLDLQFLIERV